MHSSPKIIDTYPMIQKLIASQFSQTQAEAIMQTNIELLQHQEERLEQSLAQLATKADIQNLDTKFQSLDDKIQHVEDKFDIKFQSLDDKIQHVEDKFDIKFQSLDNKLNGFREMLKKDMEVLKKDMMIFLGGNIATAVIVILGAMRYLR